MIDPVRHRQIQELEQVKICAEIWENARNQLYLNMRFLDVPLSCLGFEADWKGMGAGTDGFIIYYHPDWLCSLYESNRIFVNRVYLHMIFHCLFCHLDNKNQRDIRYWNLSCDIAMEFIIDGLYKKSVYQKQNPYRREVYQMLQKRLTVLTAEGIYEILVLIKPDESQIVKMEAEFYVDNHVYWEKESTPQMPVTRQNQWKQNRERMQTEMESFGEKEGTESEPLFHQIQAENRERYDYKKFLRKFSVIREEIEPDMDSFDYSYYMYGLSLYGNIPLIEPLETKEVKKIQDFVIAVDTSMSCSGELIQRFLEETYAVLSESESYFRKINIHIIQCDDQVRFHQQIKSQEEMKAYMEHLTIHGNGGTDFRPVFEYVNEMKQKGEFNHLRGLLYFTDGKGIYPVKMPSYETAFIFLEDEYEDISVPAWAIKLILTKEEI